MIKKSKKNEISDHSEIDLYDCFVIVSSVLYGYSLDFTLLLLLMSNKYYVVRQGLRPGIYTSREQTKPQVVGFSGAQYKSFPSMELARSAYEGNYIPTKGQYDRVQLQQLMGHNFVTSIATDAACPHNPGPVEYRGVIVSTGEEIFSFGPLNGASVNLGEFLGIVHGLSRLVKQREYTHLYSDSRTAISRVNKNTINTTIQRDNSKIREHIDRAQLRLTQHENRKQDISLVQRPTTEWGQIPADFGRK